MFTGLPALRAQQALANAPGMASSSSGASSQMALLDQAFAALPSALGGEFDLDATATNQLAIANPPSDNRVRELEMQLNQLQNMHSQWTQHASVAYIQDQQRHALGSRTSTVDPKGLGLPGLGPPPTV